MHIGEVDLAQVDEIWEAACRDAHGSEFGGPPSFLDVYGTMTVDGEMVSGYEIVALNPLIVALCDHANGTMKAFADIPPDEEGYEMSKNPSAAVGYALVGLDFGPSYLIGFA